MKKTEKIIASLLTIALGIVLMVWKGDFISILMTVAGVALIVFGVLELIQKSVPPAVVKIVTGVLIIVCGWAVVQVVLYILAAILLIAGILLLYDKIKKKICYRNLFYTICEYAMPIIFILVGIMFLFHQGKAVNFVFIVSGILTVLEGSILLVNALTEPD